MPTGQWVLLAYRLPRGPSTPRIALWRALRRLGAAQVLDGLVALPADSRTREQLEWLADGVIEAGGEGGVWVGPAGGGGKGGTGGGRGGGGGAGAGGGGGEGGGGGRGGPGGGGGGGGGAGGAGRLSAADAWT